jgi:hypothetical protein
MLTAVQTQPQIKRKLIIILSTTIFILAFWFLGVEGAIFFKSCPDCLYGKYIYQIRIFTIPIYQRVFGEETSIIQEIAMDLGTECKHPNLWSVQKWRFWGLLIPQELHSGIDRMSGGGNWYDEKARTIIKEMVKTNPSLRDEFANRVLKNHDSEYLRTFVQKVIALKNGKPVSQQ